MEWWLNHVGQMAQSVQDYSNSQLTIDLSEDFMLVESCSEIANVIDIVES